MKKYYKIYYKLANIDNSFSIMKCRQCEKTIKMYEIYNSKNIKECIKFCKKMNYEMKGFLL